MSNASGQAVRAGIREGSGSGIVAGSSASSSSRNPTIPTLVPEKNDVVKLLQSQKIEKKPAKYNAFKGIFQHRNAISTYLSALNLDADAFGAIEFGKVDSPAVNRMLDMFG